MDWDNPLNFGEIPSQEDEVVHHCATHTNTETGLACSRCGTYICPRCMIQSSVGARCGRCARAKRMPVYDVQVRQYVVAIIVAALVGGGMGVVWSLLLDVAGSVIFLPSLLAVGVGYVIGEAVSASVNRKKSFGLVVIVGLGVMVAFGLSGLMGSIVSVTGVVFALFFLAAALYVAVNRVR